MTKAGMKILLLSRYSRLGASSRLRSYQYLPFLKSHGIDVAVAPLLNDDYVKSLYMEEKKPVFSILGAFIRRLGNLLNSNRFDLVWIEYEIFPWLPAWMEMILTWAGIPYIVDYDDAIFHRYDLNPHRAVRTFLGNKINKIMKQAEIVIAGNLYLANSAIRAGTKRVEYIPTVIDLDRYSIKDRMNTDAFKIGWIGSPKTAKYLNLVKPAISHLYNKGNISLSLVGSGRLELDDVPIKILKWSEETEVSDIQNFDVGIMPLPDNPWERGKCGYKLIQYMACGKPVVASPVGANTEIVEQGINGFLAGSTEAWQEALTILRNNPDLREKMGLAGRKIVEKKYCKQVTAPKLLSIFKSMRGRRN